MASLHILALHVLMLASAEAHRLPGWVVQVAERGYTSTSLFFILSGFVLTYAYSDDETGFRGNDRSFWIGRFARLYPLLVITYLFALPLATDTSFQAAVRAVLTLTGLQAWVPVPEYSLGSVSWSLSVLALCYAVTPALLRRLQGAGSRQLAWLLGAAWLGAMVAPAMLMAWSGHPVEPSDPGMQIIHTFPLLRLPEFVFGMMLGKLFVRSGGARGPWTAWGTAAAAAVLAGVMIFGERLPYPLLHNGVLAPVHGMIVVGLASGAGAVGRFLGSRPMRALGDASLPLYMLHMPLLTYVQMVAGGAGSGSAYRTAIVLVLYLGTLLALSLAAWRWVIEPAAGWIRRRLDPANGSARRPATAAPRPDAPTLAAEGVA
jgi:peptidoglycan/LPS O-acetylase OafA/YrhL